MRDVSIKNYKFLKGGRAKACGREVERMLGMGSKRWPTLNWILANLVDLAEGEWVHYSRDKTHYTVEIPKHMKKKTGRYGDHLRIALIIKIVNEMLVHGLIEHEMGSYAAEKRSRMRPTPKMRKLFEHERGSGGGEGPRTEIKKSETVLLKGRKDENDRSCLRDYRDTTKTCAMRNKIHLFNLINEQHKWRVRVSESEMREMVDNQGFSASWFRPATAPKAALPPLTPTICKSISLFYSPGRFSLFDLGPEISCIHGEPQSGDDRAGDILPNQDVYGSDDEPSFMLELQVSTHRIFNEFFSRGGRFYGSDVQRLPQRRWGLRDRVEIDGEPTVELDFGSMHVRMIYHLESLTAPTDPYRVHGAENLRPHLKLLALITLNAPGKASALQAFRGVLVDAGLSLPGGMTAGDLALLFEHEHRTITDWFYSGCGLMLQNKDSRIAERVMHAFAKMSKPIACIHDSFIVRERDQDLLRSTMRESYRKIMHGFEPVIK